MPLEDLQPIDDLDSRREVFRLLQLFTPPERTAFLLWSAHNSLTFTPAGECVRYHVTPDTNGHDVTATYWDLMQLVAVHGISLPKMLGELERRARRVLLPAGHS